MDLQQSDGGPEQAREVFVSYSSITSDRALEIYDWLRSLGISAWLDRRELEPSDDWQEEIVNAIQGCKVFMIVAKQASFDSKHVKKELKLAQKDEKIILPVFLEEVTLKGAYRYALEEYHYVRLYDEFEKEASAGILRALEKHGVAMRPEIFKESGRHATGRAPRAPQTTFLRRLSSDAAQDPPQAPATPAPVAAPAPAPVEAPPKAAPNPITRRVLLALAPLALIGGVWLAKGVLAKDPVDPERDRPAPGVTLELLGWFKNDALKARVYLHRETAPGEFEKRAFYEQDIELPPNTPRIECDELEHGERFEVRIRRLSDRTGKPDRAGGELARPINGFTVIEIDEAKPDERHQVFPRQG